MLHNARITAFTVSELLRENQQGVKLPPPHPPTRLKDLEIIFLLLVYMCRLKNFTEFACT